LFKVENKSPLLSKEKRELFHTFVGKGLFLCIPARPDIQPAIAFLATHAQSPDEQDWSKLIKLLSYLNTTSEDV
jgi:hypothetical protein